MAIINHFPFRDNINPLICETALPAQLKVADQDRSYGVVIRDNTVVSFMLTTGKEDPHTDDILIYPMNTFYIRIDASDISNAQKTFELEPMHEYRLSKYTYAMSNATRYYGLVHFYKDEEILLAYRGFTSHIFFYWSITPFSE